MGPLDLALFDLVQLLLHAGRELHVKELGQVLHQEIIHLETDRAGLQGPLLLVHIAPGLDGGNDAGVGAGPAYPVFFQRLDQRGFGEAAGRLGLLAGLQPLHVIQRLAFDQRRQRALFLTLGQRLILFLLLLGLKAHDLHVAGEGHFRRGRAEQVGAVLAGRGNGLDLRRPLGDTRIGHLAGDEALPDQPVEPELILVQKSRHVLGRQLYIGGPDGLVRFLGSAAAAVDGRAVRQILNPKALRDQPARGLLGHRRNGGRVGSHVGDQAHRAAAQVHALVQLLGQLHGAGGGEPEKAGARLLQGAGDKRGLRPLGNLAADDLGHPHRAAFQVSPDGMRLLGVAHVRLLVVDTGQLYREGVARVLELAHPGPENPVFLRLEVQDLALALAHQPQGHRLHAARAGRAADAPPQQRAHLVAHDPVQHAAGLLGVHLVDIDFPGLGKRLADGWRGDFVIGDPAESVRVRLIAQGRHQMPGDGLPLPVRVGRQIDAVSVLGHRLQLLQHLLAGLDVDVLRLEVVVHVHPEILLRQIADVAHGGLNHKIPAQDFIDGLGLGR